MSFCEAQRWKLSSAVWRCLSDMERERKGERKARSSAYRNTFTPLGWGMSLRYIEKRIGDSTAPWGTPDWMG